MGLRCLRTGSLTGLHYCGQRNWLLLQRHHKRLTVHINWYWWEIMNKHWKERRFSFKLIMNYMIGSYYSSLLLKHEYLLLLHSLLSVWWIVWVCVLSWWSCAKGQKVNKENKKGQVESGWICMKLPKSNKQNLKSWENNGKNWLKMLKKLLQPHLNPFQLLHIGKAPILAEL